MQQMFHGYAVGFAARIDKPRRRQTCEASTALSPVGGHAKAVSRDYAMDDLFTFEEARSSVLGRFITLPGKPGTEPPEMAETRVHASVAGLTVPGVLSADYVGMTLVSERRFPDGEREFRVEEARIKNLHVRGYPPISFDALDRLRKSGDVAHLCACATARNLGHLRPTEAQGVFALHPDSEALIPPGKPAYRVELGDLKYYIYLGELLIRAGMVDLGMIRVDIHSNPREGSGSGGSGGVNGNPST
jgi:hypothetical protein